MSKHYDVAVLGAGIGALTTAALLSRRSWRVLVLGQGWRPPTYQYDGMTLARRPFTFLVGSSPLWSRVLVELAQTQTFRRRTVALDPMLQVLAPKLRLDFAPDVQVFGKEIDRTFPEVRRVVDELYAELARTNGAADAAFERDMVWPPGTFWERREAERVVASVPRFEAGRWPPLLAQFPRAHDYRAVVAVPARFASRSTEPPEFAVARLHGAWTRGVMGMQGGEQGLVDFLVDRVEAQGGQTRLDESAASVAHKRGRVSGIVIDGEEQETGVDFVVTDHTTRALLDLASDFDPPRRALSALPQLASAEWRFVVSIVVRTEGLPSMLSEEASGRRGDCRRSGPARCGGRSRGGPRQHRGAPSVHRAPLSGDRLAPRRAPSLGLPVGRAPRRAARELSQHGRLSRRGTDGRAVARVAAFFPRPRG
jgi:phytoene dehydrogenase-like protein